MGYGLRAQVGRPYGQVLDQVRLALVEQQFTILTETDVSQLLDDQLGVEMPPQTALGVCSLPALRALLDVEPSIGLLVPIPVVVRAQGVGGTVVEAANPRLLVATTGHPGLEPVAADVSARMTAVFHTLASRSAAHPPGSAKVVDDTDAGEPQPPATSLVRL